MRPLSDAARKKPLCVYRGTLPWANRKKWGTWKAWWKTAKSCTQDVGGRRKQQQTPPPRRELTFNNFTRSDTRGKKRKKRKKRKEVTHKNSPERCKRKRHTQHHTQPPTSQWTFQAPPPSPRVLRGLRAAFPLRAMWNLLDDVTVKLFSELFGSSYSE